MIVLNRFGVFGANQCLISETIHISARCKAAFLWVVKLNVKLWNRLRLWHQFRNNNRTKKISRVLTDKSVYVFLLCNYIFNSECCVCIFLCYVSNTYTAIPHVMMLVVVDLQACKLCAAESTLSLIHCKYGSMAKYQHYGAFFVLLLVALLAAAILLKDCIRYMYEEFSVSPYFYTIHTLRTLHAYIPSLQILYILAF